MEASRSDWANALNDMEILKQFILGFTARDTDKEWQAFRRLRAYIEVLKDKKEIVAKVGDRISVMVVNDKKKFSAYEQEITKEDLEGEGLHDWFLAETSGFE